MRKSSIDKTFDNFYRDMQFDLEFLIKIESARQVVKAVKEKQDVFEAYVFRICANWEMLVERLFIDCFNKDTSQFQMTTGFMIPKHLSIETCKAIILQTGFFDYKNIGHLKRLSKEYLATECNPFIVIPPTNGKKIDEFFTLRNHIAHHSSKSKRTLQKMYNDIYKFKTFIRPGQFLLSEDRLTKDRLTKIPRMGTYINNFLVTSVIMAKIFNIDVELYTS